MAKFENDFITFRNGWRIAKKCIVGYKRDEFNGGEKGTNIELNHLKYSYLEVDETVDEVDALLGKKDI